MRRSRLQVIFPAGVSLLLAVLLAVPVLAAPVLKSGAKDFEGATGRLSVEVSASEMSIADSLTLTVEVLTPKGFTAQLPNFNDFGFATDFNERSHRFRATDISEPETIHLNDSSTLSRRHFTLEPWLSGDYAIMPQMVSFYREKEASTEARQPQVGKEAEKSAPQYRTPAFNVMTEGIRIKVTALAEERQEFSDIFGQANYDLDRLRERQRRKEDKSNEELRREEKQEQEAAAALSEKKFPWRLLAALLLCGLAAPLLWFFGRKKIKRYLSPKPQPAHEIAYQALAALEARNLPQSGRIKEYYYELSYILRIYIGNRFQIFAVKQTSEEFFHQLLRANPFDAQGEDILRRFSEQADTVKYSLFRPDPGQAAASCTLARSFVDHTKQKEEEKA